MQSEYNAYPVSKNFSMWREPDQQKQKKTKSIQDTLEQLPLLKNEAEQLKDLIDYYSSVDSIDVDLSKDPEMHRNVMAANRVIRDGLKAVRSRLLADIEKATR